MATKKKDQNDGLVRCITRREMSNKEGSERWGIGAEIWLEPEIAQRHHAKGNVYYGDEVTPPAEPAPTVIINEPVVTPEQLEGIANGNTDSSSSD